MDSFDYKPALTRLHGQTVPGPERPMGFMGRVGRLHRPHFAFKRRGQSGLWVSDLFPHLAGLADELTVIRSLWSGTGNHTPATYEAHSGFRLRDLCLGLLRLCATLRNLVGRRARAHQSGLGLAQLRVL